MKDEKIINVRVDEDHHNRFNELCNIYTKNNKKKLICFMIDYFDNIDSHGEVNIETKRKCMESLCEIANLSALIDDGQIQTDIQKEVSKLCQILK